MPIAPICWATCTPSADLIHKHLELEWDSSNETVARANSTVHVRKTQLRGQGPNAIKEVERVRARICSITHSRAPITLQSYDEIAEKTVLFQYIAQILHLDMIKSSKNKPCRIQGPHLRGPNVTKR